PNSIANQIVEKIEELAVIFPACTKFFGAGELTFAVDNNNIGITAAYSEDMAEITESGTKFETVKLSNHIIGSLTKISRSLIN
ncbi:phage major capsid protein, partial [Acinetobacter baumannii]|nr:phage major capsid protein [Acinetobacter baumannii]